MSTYLTQLNAVPRERLMLIGLNHDATPEEINKMVMELLLVRDENEIRQERALRRLVAETLGMEVRGQSILHPTEKEPDGGALHVGEST